MHVTQFLFIYVFFFVFCLSKPQPTWASCSFWAWSSMRRISTSSTAAWVSCSLKIRWILEEKEALIWAYLDQNYWVNKISEDNCWYHIPDNIVEVKSQDQGHSNEVLAGSLAQGLKSVSISKDFSPKQLILLCFLFVCFFFCFVLFFFCKLGPTSNISFSTSKTADFTEFLFVCLFVFFNFIFQEFLVTN